MPSKPWIPKFAKHLLDIGALLISGNANKRLGINATYDALEAQTPPMTKTSTTVAPTTSTDTLNASGALKLDKQAYYDEEVANAIVANAVTIDWTAGNKQKLTRDANVTMTWTAPTGPCNLQLRFVHANNATTYSVAFPSTVVKWPGGSAMTFTNTANAVDLLSMYFNGTNYYCMGVNAFA